MGFKKIATNSLIKSSQKDEYFFKIGSKTRKIQNDYFSSHNWFNEKLLLHDLTTGAKSLIE